MRFIKHLLKFGLPFGISMGFYFGFAYNIKYGIAGGVASGILFGIIMATFALKRNKKYQTIKQSMSSDTGNEIIFESYANHIAGFFPIEGCLFLTKTKLIFMNNKSEKTEYPLNTIQQLRAGRHRLNPNALCFFANGKEEKFIFEDIGGSSFVNNVMWVEIIRAEIAKADNPSDHSVHYES